MGRTILIGEGRPLDKTDYSSRHRRIWALSAAALLVSAVILAAVILVFVPALQDRHDPSTSEQPFCLGEPVLLTTQCSRANRGTERSRIRIERTGSPLIGASPGVPMAGGFSQQLKDLQIQLDQKSLQAAGGGWDVTAHDKTGKTWHVGLIRNSTGSLVIVYGEAQQ